MRPDARRRARHRTRSATSPRTRCATACRTSSCSAPTACRACARPTASTKRSTVGMEHDLAYQALADGAIDVSDGYSTDAKIARPRPAAAARRRALLSALRGGAAGARRPVHAALPAAEAALRLLAGRIDAATMRRLNLAVEVERRAPAEVAAGVSRASSASATRAGGGRRARHHAARRCCGSGAGSPPG